MVDQCLARQHLIGLNYPSVSEYVFVKIARFGFGDLADPGLENALGKHNTSLHNGTSVLNVVAAGPLMDSSIKVTDSLIRDA